MHLYVTATRDTTSYIFISTMIVFCVKTKKCNSHHKKYKLNEFRDWWLLWCLLRLLLFLKRWQKTNKKNIFVEKITDTFENLCCNIRNVKSNYLKCIALKCFSPPSVLFLLWNYGGWRKIISRIHLIVWRLRNLGFYRWLDKRQNVRQNRIQFTLDLCEEVTWPPFPLIRKWF